MSNYFGAVPILAFILWWVLFPEHAARTYSDFMRRNGVFPDKRVPTPGVFRILGIVSLVGFAFLLLFGNR
jgi:hypothetical protein